MYSVSVSDVCPRVPPNLHYYPPNMYIIYIVSFIIFFPLPLKCYIPNMVKIASVVLEKNMLTRTTNDDCGFLSKIRSIIFCLYI